MLYRQHSQRGPAAQESGTAEQPGTKHARRKGFASGAQKVGSPASPAAAGCCGRSTCTLHKRRYPLFLVVQSTTFVGSVLPNRILGSDMSPGTCSTVPPENTTLASAGPVTAVCGKESYLRSGFAAEAHRGCDYARASGKDERRRTRRKRARETHLIVCGPEVDESDSALYSQWSVCEVAQGRVQHDKY